MPKFATVVLEIPVDRQFDYLVPPELEGTVVPGVRVYVPFRSRRMSAYVVSVSEGKPHPGAKPIMTVRDAKPVIGEPVMRLAEWMASYYYCAIPAAIRCILPSSVRAGHRAKMPIFVTVDRTRVEGGGGVDALCPRAPKQALILKDLLGSEKPAAMQALLRRTGATQAAVRALEKKGLVTLARRRVWRDPWGDETVIHSGHLAPTPDQARALAHTGKALAERRFSVMLLHGVTASGKTEVYLQAIDDVLKSGRGAIMLVPEIALTPQTVEGFKARFARNVAVLHSRLSDGERLDEWEKVRDGKARVVVGARSAIFAPVADLGLIIVDEEHEHSYKQEDTPRYHARDVAVMRGKIEGAVVILGSATPSVESYRNALAGRYRLFRLPHRIGNRPLAPVTIVDMREEIRRVGRMTFFSRRLLAAMEDRLDKGQQVILFLNRRGFSPILSCRRCGFVQKCPNCSISLTTHREGETMLCHLCGFQGKSPSRCPKCGSPGIRFPGLGTQKLELMVKKLFPDRTVGRMDADSMAGKDAHAETLGAFKRGEIQILLGTQMIAKGLHFPNVTLVGVICADTALNLPDFRSSEVTFQLITQVAGRAGRGDVPGEVIVQTYAPTHPAILAARGQDYETFYRKEIVFREELGYPPVNRFVAVTLRGRGEEAVRWYSRQFARAAAAAAPAGIKVLGPATAPIARAKGYYRWQVILKGESVPRMNDVLKIVAGGLKPPKGIQIVVDADPIAML